MAVKLLHTADWQLGRAFAKLPEETAVPLKQQRIATVKKIAEAANNRQVDAVLVAGDVFEFETIAERTLHQVLSAMSAYKGPWLMLPGNHDPGTDESVWSQLRRLDELPGNVIILDNPTPYEIPGTSAIVMPAPLKRKHESGDITEWFDGHDTNADTIRIGLAHGSIDNRLPERGEAPNTISDRRAESARLDYLALGDWHGTLNAAHNTWYSGTHETDRFRDNDSGNVLFVSINGPGQKPQVEKIPVGHYVWRQLHLSLMSDDAGKEIEQAISALGHDQERLVVQLILQGTATLQMRAQIERAITKYSGLLCYFECKDEALVSEASASDLEELAETGFIADAVAQLRAQSSDRTNPDADIARLALQMLYLEHKQTVGKR